MRIMKVVRLALPRSRYAELERARRLREEDEVAREAKFRDGKAEVAEKMSRESIKQAHRNDYLWAEAARSRDEYDAAELAKAKEGVMGAVLDRWACPGG